LRCPTCGTDVEVSWSYCRKCGADLKAAMKPEEENYLGGVFSEGVYREPKPIWGFAIHATDRRLLAVPDAKPSRHRVGGFIIALGQIAGAGQMTGPTSADPYCRVYKPMVSKEKNAEMIKELDGKPKDFELLREETQRIEMKKPGVLGGGGYINIIGKPGSDINLKIRSRRAFKELKNLMTRFCNEVTCL
jgi:hypothetical protein